MIMWLLVLIGAINWGLVGLGGFFDANWNVLNLIFGSWMSVEYAIYILIGLSGAGMLFHAKGCGSCGKCGKNMEGHGGNNNPQM